MSRSFTKLFSSITESTVWCEPLATRVCWIAMLAMADRHGRVWASVPGLANRARISIDEAKTALERFQTPDPYSRTPDYEGRRIEVIDGGWRLLNYAKYRALRDEEERREYQREWDRQHRSRGARNPTNPTASDRARPAPTQAEAEAKAEKEPSAGRQADAARAQFAQAWKAMPKRAGHNPKARAERAFRARLRDGCSPGDMIAGVERYARYCDAMGKTGTEYVMQGATFFGPDKPFEQPYAIATDGGRWDATDDGILAKARELGISTRGESTQALIAQIRTRLSGNGASA